MKKWWIGYTGKDGGVCEVEVVGTRNVGTEWEAPTIRLADGTVEDAARCSVFDTEAGARRARVVEEVEDLEDEARNLEESANHKLYQAAESSLKAARYKGEAAALRARAKGLRDALEEVKDAMEGRR